MAPAAATPPAQPASFRFGRFELQPGERRLLVEGQAVNVGARAFDLLATLATRPDRLVTKNELLDLVWPGLVVEESNLHTQISTLRKLLGGDVIATVPGRGYRFTAAPLSDEARTDDAPAAAAAAPAPPRVATAAGGVPQPGSGRLIGRDADLARLEPTLREPGCVTLVGAGGVGKTRLALAAAQRRDGRRIWVDMAPLAEGTQVAGALARALGLPLADTGVSPQLVRALAGEPALLVLDNAEHLVEAVATLAAALLLAVPQLHLLVTSQVALGVAGERVLRIEPLAIEAEHAGAASGNGALALLVERIAAADHRVRIEPAAQPLLREICRQLDGLPLALEMAAARVPLLGLKGVRDELAQRFALLTTGHRNAAQRHRTLHAALDWSFNLLGGEEQQLFAALGVFAGGFSLDLCVALVDEPGTGSSASRWEVIDRLAALVDRSLVAVGSEDPPRYRLLETMRAYALEKLQSSGAGPLVRHRHAEVLMQFLRAHVADRDHAVCEPELDNVREAIAWTKVHAPALAVELAGCATTVTTFNPWRAQALAWMSALEPLMESPQAESIDLALRVFWWNEYARMSISSMRGNGHALARKARALALEHGNPQQRFNATVAVVSTAQSAGPELDAACAEITALVAANPQWTPRARLSAQGALAIAAELRGDREGKLAVRYEELRLAREAGLQGAADAAETNVVAALSELGRHAEALEHARAVVQRLDGTRSVNVVWAFDGLVSALIELDRLDEARPALARAMAIGRDFDLPVSAPLLARLAWRRQRYDAAARLLGFVRHTYEQQALGMFGPTWDEMAAIEQTLKDRLGAARVEGLVREGRGLADAAAVGLACGE